MAEQRDFSKLGAYDDLDRIILHAAEIIANQSPIDTGNLRINAIKAEWVDTEHTAFRIYLDPSATLRKSNKKKPNHKGKKGKDEKAEQEFDYAVWLDESPDSPHQGWWDKACLDAVNYIRRVLG